MLYENILKLTVLFWFLFILNTQYIIIRNIIFINITGKNTLFFLSKYNFFFFMRKKKCCYALSIIREFETYSVCLFF